MKSSTLKNAFAESSFGKWFFAPLEGSIFSESIIFKPLSGLFSSWQEKGFVFLKYVLAALVVASLFAPRFMLGSLSLSYQVYVRPDDLLFVLLLGMVLPGMLKKEDSGWGMASIEKAFVFFLMVCAVSILNGFYFRTIDKPLVSLLYLAKWTQYFLLFAITARLSMNKQATRFFLAVFFLSGILVSIYGYTEYFSPHAKALYPNYYRLFERPPFHGDANHIGGFLVFWIAFFSGLFLKEKNPRKTLLLLVGLLFVFFPMIWTYSRKSYLALGATFSIFFMIVPERKKMLWLLSLFVLAGLLFPTRLAERLIDLGDFTGSDPFHASWTADIAVWQRSLWNFSRFFVFGAGWGARHRLFYESQYLMILTETGLVGFSCFLFLCLSLVRQAFSYWVRFSKTPDGAMLFGWFMAFMAFMFHSFSCVSWTVSKMAVPFWFLTAFVFAHFKTETAPAEERFFAHV